MNATNLFACIAIVAVISIIVSFLVPHSREGIDYKDTYVARLGDAVFIETFASLLIALALFARYDEFSGAFIAIVIVGVNYMLSHACFETAYIISNSARKCKCFYIAFKLGILGGITYLAYLNMNGAILT